MSSGLYNIVSLLIFQGFHELLHIFKASVDTGKTNIGDIVKQPEFPNNFLANQSCWDLFFSSIDDPGGNSINKSFNLLEADWALLASGLNSLKNLLSVERFSTAIFLHDKGKDQTDGFDCRKSRFALQAFSSTADAIEFPTFAGI